MLISLIILIMAINTDAAYSASINFYGEKTDVIVGEDILLKLSIVNLVSNPTMNAQIIILPSSGTSVISTDFVKVAAGQYAADYELRPGDGREIEIKLRTNQPGDFIIKGRVIYYFGNDSQNAQDFPLELPIKIKEDPYFRNDQAVRHREIPGFDIIIGILSLILIYMVKEYRKKK